MIHYILGWLRHLLRPSLDSLMMSAQQALRLGRVKTAKELYETALVNYPEHSLMLRFNLGYVSEQVLCDGSNARTEYQLALASDSGRTPILDCSPIETVEANACENLMLLSLSYDEYEAWSQRLEQLRPNEKILRVQRLQVREMNERGLPWWCVLDWFCDNYCDFIDPASDAGLYAKAAATYGLIIENREAMRVPHDEYRVRAGLYGSCIGKVCSGYAGDMERLYGTALLGEIQPIVERAVVFIDDCAGEFPADKRLHDVQRLLYRTRLGDSNENQPSLVRKSVAECEPHTLTYAEHYEFTCRQGVGEKRWLSLIQAEADGNIVSLVYRWNAALSSEEADALDTRARGYIACAIYDAALTAGLTCQSGPPHGQRPSWLFPGERIPVSLINAGYDLTEKTCFMQIGPGMMMGGPSSSGNFAKRLVAGFRAQFREIHV